MFRKDLGVLIPVYNEEKSIGLVLKSLSNYTKNIICVNDCSTDSTKVIISNFPIHGVNLPKNLGYENALRVGFMEATQLGFNYLITMDADGEHRIEDVIKIAQALNESCDLVIGIRDFLPRISEKIMAFYCGYKFGVKDPLCGLKGYNLDYYKKTKIFSSYDSTGTQLMFSMIRTKCNFRQIPITINKRQEGTSRFGSTLKANVKIFKTLANILKQEKLHE